MRVPVADFGKEMSTTSMASPSSPEALAEMVNHADSLSPEDLNELLRAVSKTIDKEDLNPMLRKSLDLCADWAWNPNVPL